MELLDMSTGRRKRHDAGGSKIAKFVAFPLAIAIVSVAMNWFYDSSIHQCCETILVSLPGFFGLHICGSPLPSPPLATLAVAQDKSFDVPLWSTALEEMKSLAASSALLPRHVQIGEENVRGILEAVTVTKPSFKYCTLCIFSRNQADWEPETKLCPFYLGTLSSQIMRQTPCKDG
jgi:hypothetical protein